MGNRLTAIDAQRADGRWPSPFCFVPETLQLIQNAFGTIAVVRVPKRGYYYLSRSASSPNGQVLRRIATVQVRGWALL